MGVSGRVTEYFTGGGVVETSCGSLLMSLKALRWRRMTRNGRGFEAYLPACVVRARPWVGIRLVDSTDEDLQAHRRLADSSATPWRRYLLHRRNGVSPGYSGLCSSSRLAGQSLTPRISPSVAHETSNRASARVSTPAIQSMRGFHGRARWILSWR